MKHLPLIALMLLFSFSASSFGADNFRVLGNYKELRYAIEDVAENYLGVTKEDIERVLKLRISKSSIKRFSQRTIAF